MKQSFSALVRGLFAVVLFAGAVTPCHAQSQSPASPEITRGVQWLAAQVQANGSLLNESQSIATQLQSRSEAAVTLKLLATLPASLGNRIHADTESNSNEAHHTIPVYLCGRDSQPKANISTADHIALHSALDKVPFAFNLAGTIVSLILVRRKAKTNLPTLSQYLKKSSNRAVLVAALAGYYAPKYLALPNLGGTGTFGTIFALESGLFIKSKTNTSLPTCRK